MDTIKKIFETSWGGMVRRSSGEVVRKEAFSGVPARIDEEDCTELLKQGIVLFVYRKKHPVESGREGEIRIAWGTKQFDSLTFPVPAIKNKGIFNHGGTIYIDMNAEDWRVAYEIVGAYTEPFFKKEYENLSNDKIKKLEEELLKETDLYDEYEEQKRIKMAQLEAKRKREEARLAAAGVETGGDTPVDGEPTV